MMRGRHPKKNRPSQWGVLHVLCAVVLFLVLYGAIEYVMDEKKKKKPEKPKVHVVVAGDRAQSLGIVACARSMLNATNSPDRIVLHVIVEASLVTDITTALECALQRKVSVYAFDLGGRLMIRPPRNKAKTNLASSLNFARFYLHDILPKDVEKILWLDADTVVLRDIVPLYDEAFRKNDFAVAAVSRKDVKHVCGPVVHCDLPEVRDLLRSKGISHPEADLDAFNAGVMLLDLQRWVNYGYTEDVEFWIQKNTELPLYDLASNPPLVLTIRRDFQRLDESWNCHHGSPCWDGNASVMHWNGAKKPWALLKPSDHFIWLPHLVQPNRYGLPRLRAYYATKQESRGLDCLASLPPLASNIVNDVADEPRPLMVVDKKRKKSSPFAPWERRWRAHAQNKSLAVDEALARAKTVVDASSADLFAKVTSAIGASIVGLPKKRPEDLVKEFLDFLKNQQDDRCHYVIVAIINGKISIDVRHFGVSATCGIVPPESLVTSLQFLAMMVHTDPSQFPNAVFLLQTEPSPGGVGPPIFAYYGSRRRRQHIVVPGPSVILQELSKRTESGLGAALAQQRLYRDISPDERIRMADETTTAMLEEWQSRYDALAERQLMNATWFQRKAVASWRGRLDAGFDCDDDETWSYVELLTTSLLHPKQFEARITKALEPKDVDLCVARASLHPTLKRKATKLLRMGYTVSRNAQGNLENYFVHRYAVVMSSSVWGVGAAVLLWDDDHEWFDAALENGRTHISVGFNTIAHVVDELNAHPDAAFALARQARTIFTTFFKPTNVANVWVTALTKYSNHFDLTSSDLAALLQAHNVPMTPIDLLPSWFFAGSSSSSSRDHRRTT